MFHCSWNTALLIRFLILCKYIENINTSNFCLCQVSLFSITYLLEFVGKLFIITLSLGDWIALSPKIMSYIRMVQSRFSHCYNCHISERKHSAFHEHFICLESLRFPRGINHIIKQKCLVWSILQHSITFSGKSFMKELTVSMLFSVVYIP